jgi:predicted acylesterase/phospholipase RssA
LELLDLLSLYAPQKRYQLPDRFLLYAQDALNRAGIGTEFLGAEPLERLIKAHVLTESEDRGAHFSEFLERSGIHFMATATNLTTGELDVVGSFCSPDRLPALVPGLLASSAFPAVFRPRMNWELRAGSPGAPEELIDGGIADNLPIIPVYRFLFGAGHSGCVKLRPTVPSNNGKSRAVPHLLLTASLESRKLDLEGQELRQTADSWPSLKSRVTQLKYNVKVDSHRQTQVDLRKIQAKIQAALDDKKKNGIAQTAPASSIELPDLHISCVKPEWLCGTFAFHPMLGFKRSRQAASIAHGCASTFVHLHCEQNENPDWVSEWWQPIQLHSDVLRASHGSGIRFELHPQKPNDKGDCCVVKGLTCPFSRKGLESSAKVACSESDQDPALDPLGTETKSAVEEIYRQCGKRTAHQRVEE